MLIFEISNLKFEMQAAGLERPTNKACETHQPERVP
jgi:hypothetical protein